MSRLERVAEIEVIGLMEIAGQTPMAGCSVIQRAAQEMPGAQTACVQMTDRLGGVLYWPLFMSGVSYWSSPIPADDLGGVLKGYARYVSSVGYSAGVTIQDSLVHGILESIEHDAVSAMLIGLVTGGQCGAREVEIQEYIEPELARSVISECGRSFSLVLLPSFVPSVHVFAALGPVRSTGLRDYGLGASTDPVYAAARAASELAQGNVARRLSPDLYHQRDLLIRRRLQRWPNLTRALALILPLEEGAGGHTAPVDGAATPSVADSMRLLCESLGPVGGVYWLRLTPDAYPVTVTLVACPGLDRFDALLQGWPILPTGRLGSRLANTPGGGN